MSMSFKNKIVWVTGASSGIGEALAKALSTQGAKIIISARKKDGLYTLKQKLNSNPLDIHVLPLDLEKSEELFDKAKEALKIYGHVDILINAGGISQRSLALETLPEIEQKII